MRDSVIGREMSHPPVTIAEGHDPSVFEYTDDAAIARGYDELHEGSGLFRTDTAFLDEVIPARSRVVDLGCGTGRHVLHLARRGCEVTGVDLSPWMLRKAARKLGAQEYEARLVRADICRLEALADSSFDAAICMFSTLGILRGRALRLRALTEWRRVLRPGGLLVAHVHNLWRNAFDPWGRWWIAGSFLGSVLPRREFGDKWMEGYRGLARLYIHVFRLRELRGILTGAAFRIEREVLLNEARTGPIEGRLQWLRANGFIVAARKE